MFRERKRMDGRTGVRGKWKVVRERRAGGKRKRREMSRIGVFMGREKCPRVEYLWDANFVKVRYERKAKCIVYTQ